MFRTGSVSTQQTITGQSPGLAYKVISDLLVGSRVRSRELLPGGKAEGVGQTGLLQQKAHGFPSSAPEHPGLWVWAPPWGLLCGGRSIELSSLSQGSCTHCDPEVPQPLDHVQ